MLLKKILNLASDAEIIFPSQDVTNSGVLGMVSGKKKSLRMIPIICKRPKAEVQVGKADYIQLYE